jgi:hypothetical protein
MRGCGRIERPAFPAPSVEEGGDFSKIRAHSRRGNADCCLNVIACDKREAFAHGSGSDEAIQLLFLPRQSWIASRRSQ